MLFLLVCLLLIVLVINYFISNRILLTPSVVFTASFLVSCLFALLYQRQWSLTLHLNTFLTRGAS